MIKHAFDIVRKATYPMAHMQNIPLLEIRCLAIGSGAKREVISSWQKECSNRQA
jgi:hypothetical protein